MVTHRAAFHTCPSADLAVPSNYRVQHTAGILKTNDQSSADIRRTLYKMLYPYLHVVQDNRVLNAHTLSDGDPWTNRYIGTNL